ncbi:thymidylate synthase [Phragmitibacter flavus]|uniref:Thymidylate synthase n=1 Tax=Phragmitibacter flavus TaxID=2576071 RepID=A0A5R8KHC6_9BACT|nr:thymidylate synthase [Phragmitibacter flavus]TLD71682.1 thymidylate synthase [Phragmitibacter flavus]
MFQTLEARTANDLWKQAAEWFRQDDKSVRQASRNGPTQEVMNVALSLQYPRQRWIAARVPAMNPAFAIAEVVWIVSGRNDSAMLNYFNAVLPRYAGEGTTYHGAYGHRIRSSFGVDQLERAYHALSAKSDSRQVVLQIWDSRIDLPSENGSEASKDVPCNVCSLLKVRDGKLEWTQIMRSNDLFRGFPHNVIQFSSLQEILAGWLKVEVGAYHHYSDSLHLYDQDGDVASHFEDISSPDNEDTLSLVKSESDAAFLMLGQLCDFCANTERSSDEVFNHVSNLHLPAGHANLARVLAADALRRRNAFGQAQEVMQQCTNPCLRFMTQRWFSKPR